MKVMYLLGKAVGIAALVLPLTTTVVDAKPSAKSQKVIDHWTPARIQQAIPRQLVVASNGMGYLKKPDGSLQPHGHNRLVEVTKVSKQPMAKPGTGGGDSDGGPDISLVEPGDGAIIGASQRFAASITDDSGVRSASLVITPPSGGSQSFSMSSSDGETWESSLQGFTESEGWSWHVEAKDASKGKGNTAVSEIFTFNVVTSGEPPPPPPTGDGVVTNGNWFDDQQPDEGLIQESVGRIYFEMPSNPRLKRWAGYVCSGTVAKDVENDGRTVIITAAHCAYDDVNKAFARNVLFIPNQDQTDGSGTDSNCENDPLGCWTPDFAVVDEFWTTATFPDNIPWDYAYYVVPDSGAHEGAAANESLEIEVGGLPISFAVPAYVEDNTPGDPYTHGIGYSYADDPNLMYCAENMTTEGPDNWWLPSCGLSGGSSGGPWVQPMAFGEGPIISVNSWGYNGSPGMAGPILVETSAECLFDEAKNTEFADVSDADGQQGVVAECP